MSSQRLLPEAPLAKAAADRMLRAEGLWWAGGWRAVETEKPLPTHGPWRAEAEGEGFLCPQPWGNVPEHLGPELTDPDGVHGCIPGPAQCGDRASGQRPWPPACPLRPGQGRALCPDHRGERWATFLRARKGQGRKQVQREQGGPAWHCRHALSDGSPVCPPPLPPFSSPLGPHSSTEHLAQSRGPTNVCGTNE